MREFLAYAEFDSFWQRFHPETPFGRDVKERREIQVSPEALEALWDRTETALAFLQALQGDEVASSRVTHHLKRLPRFPQEPRPVYDEVELFQFKKFLHNYRALVGLLTPEVQEAFGLRWDSDSLEQLLSVGRQSAESFYISDEYADDLARVRAEIRDVDERTARARTRRALEIQERWDLAFGHREFLVVPRERLVDLSAAAELLLVEPYDDRSYLVRPRGGAEELALAEERARLLGRERSCEDRVLEQLAEALRGELERLDRYREAVKAFDLAFARARLARDYGLSRPVMVEDGPLEIEGGRFLPCEEACRQLGTVYEPLDAIFDASATVIFGSNMGGKTIVLKTVAFLQLCAQAGLFVPARRFSSRVFQHFHYIGEGFGRQPVHGLSGFGFEIRQFQAAWHDFARPTLALFDEFARTTHSREAEALISAVLEAMTDIPHLVALFSTHFRGVRRLPGVRYLRMQGLDRDGLDLEVAVGTELEERIRLIDRHMEYRLVEDEGGPRSSDAIAVATLLGVDPGLAGRAECFFLEGT